MRSLVVAVGFLTRIPVPQKPWRDGDLARATMWFPAVGVIVGAAGVLTRFLAGLAMPAFPATVLSVAAMIAITGALHEDGLADTADGLWGASDPEERLAILKDSRIGTYGALAVTLAVVLRVGVLTSLDLDEFTRAVLVAHVLGRASTLLMVRWLPDVGGGSGAAVAEPIRGLRLLLPSLTVAAVCISSVGMYAWLLLTVAVVVAGASAAVYRAKVGGVTGDLLGATNQLVHLSSLVAVQAVLT